MSLAKDLQAIRTAKDHHDSALLPILLLIRAIYDHPHQVNSTTVCKAVQCSRATYNRWLEQARDMGATIRFDGRDGGRSGGAYIANQIDEDKIDRWIGLERQRDVRLYESEQASAPVVIVEAWPFELWEAGELHPVATLDAAKRMVRECGYRVLDDDEGGQCESTEAWDPARGLLHVVTVEPPER